MKKLFCFLLLLLLSWNTVIAQPGFIKTFYHTGGQEEISEYRDVLVDNDTIVLYSSSFDDNNKQGIRFAKIDTFGTVLKEKIFVDSVLTLTSTIYLKKIIRTADGGYAILGSAGSPTLYLLKVNHELELDFLVKYTDSLGATMLNSTLMELSDGYMLVGHRSVNWGGDIFVIRTDEEGQEIWRKQYGEPNIREKPFAIKRQDDEFIIYGGTSDVIQNQQATWVTGLLLSIDSLGNENWSWKSEEGSEPGPFIDAYILHDSSRIIISGTWEWDEEFGQYSALPMILRLDKDFNIMWQKKFGILSGFQAFRDLVRTAEGNFIASGNMWHKLNDIQYVSKAVHYKFTPEGDSLWMRHDSAFELTYISGTDLLSSGSIISIGYTDDFGGRFGVLMKLTPDGCIDTLNCWPVADYEPFTPENEVSAYPNPFNDYLTVNISAYPQNAYIYHHDVMGRFLRKERVRHGANELDVSDFPKGMVFYEVRDVGVVIGRGKLVRE